MSLLGIATVHITFVPSKLFMETDFVNVSFAFTNNIARKTKCADVFLISIDIFQPTRNESLTVINSNKSKIVKCSVTFNIKVA